MTATQITVALLTWLLVPVYNAWADRKGAKRNYIIVNILRGIALILHGIFMFDMQGGYFRIEDAVRNGPILAFYFTSYWLVFELLLNTLTGRIKQYGLIAGLLYYDRSENDSGWIDGFFMRHPRLHTPAKLLALLVMVVSVILIYKF